MRRRELIASARRLAAEKGFTLEGTHAIATAKRALQALARQSKVVTPRIGWWQIAGDLNQVTREPAVKPESPNSQSEGSPIAEENHTLADGVTAEGALGKLTVGHRIGEGPECVYVYYHDSDAKLAKLDGQSSWPCKVGYTIGEPDARIIGQGAMTCFHRPPIVGLVIRTHDARSLERVLHSALTYVGRRIDAGAGSEWFNTSPERIERWFQAHLETLALLE